MGRAREEDWPEMADVTVARSSERHVGNRESIQMLGRYVTVLRKRTRQCKAPNGVLDNVIARGPRALLRAVALSNLELNARTRIV